MTKSLVDYPIILSQKKATLTLLLHENKSHPLFPKLQLVAILLSGKQWEIKSFRRKLWTSCLSWRDTRTFCYEWVLRQWKNYCCQRGVDPLVTVVKNVLDFLHGMYKRGCRYRSICEARSHFLVQLYLDMRGCQTALSYLDI